MAEYPIGTKRFLRAGLDDHCMMVAEFGVAEGRVTFDEMQLREQIARNAEADPRLDDSEERRGLHGILRKEDRPYDALARIAPRPRPTPEPAAVADMFPNAR